MSKENKILALLILIILIVNLLAFLGVYAILSDNYTESELRTMAVLLGSGVIVMLLAGNEAIQYLKRD